MRKILSELNEGDSFYYVGNEDVFRCTLKKKDTNKGYLVLFYSENGGTYDSLLHPLQEVFDKKDEAISYHLDISTKRKYYIESLISDRQRELEQVKKIIEKYTLINKNN